MSTAAVVVDPIDGRVTAETASGPTVVNGVLSQVVSLLLLLGDSLGE